jgi:hypothetical protein
MRSRTIVILGLLLVNAVVTDVLIAKLWKKSKVVETKTVVETKYVYPTLQPTALVPSPTAEPTKVVVVPKKNKNTTIVPIPGSGSTGEIKWTDLAGTEFYLSTSDYPGLKEAYLEANMRLFNGNGVAFVRLFDVTAGIEVWGSEVKTSSQNSTAVTSERLTLREGNRLYRIQAKSLTNDTVMYGSGRIRIVTEN